MSKKIYKADRFALMPPKSDLGLPKKDFSDTFSAVTALKEHFNIKD